jgi:threonine dehydrogenase-like Zn-dependent dehydrogenase
MNHRFRSAVLTSPRSATLEKIPLPDPAPGQVRIRLEGCGVCGSNLPVWEGRPWFKYPLAPGSPGHEGWGFIEEVGDGVASLHKGDRVAMLSYNAFAEVDVADANHVTLLPPQLAGQPFPGEALGCAMNVFRRADILPGAWVAIVGIGFLGALLTDLVTRAGGRVIAISRRPFALDTAARMGALHTFTMGDSRNLVGDIMALTGGHGCERVIEAAGCQTTLDLATQLTAERAKLVIAGYHQDGTRQVDMQLWNWRGLDVINAHERDPRVYLEGMRAAADAVAKGSMNPAPLYTHQYRLDQLPDAMEHMARRDGHFMKSLLTYA